MAQLIFTQQLARFTSVPEVHSSATLLRAALDDAFAGNPQLRGYVLDEQGYLRDNVVIFIDGRRMRERKLLDDPLQSDSTVYILQALSGG
jgi:molybdopterin synthase sulfur carrier subunit